MMRMPTLEISYDGVTDRAHESKWHAAHVLLRRIVCAGSKEFYIMYFTCRVLQMSCPQCHAGFAASIAEQLSFKLPDFSS